jgi:hypothetical protein
LTGRVGPETATKTALSPICLDVFPIHTFNQVSSGCIALNCSSLNVAFVSDRRRIEL